MKEKCILCIFWGQEDYGIGYRKSGLLLGELCPLNETELLYFFSMFGQSSENLLPLKNIGIWK